MLGNDAFFQTLTPYARMIGRSQMLNLLVAVLVEVVGVLAVAEQEMVQTQHLAFHIIFPRRTLKKHDKKHTMQEQEGSAMGPVNLNFSQRLSYLDFLAKPLFTASTFWEVECCHVAQVWMGSNEISLGRAFRRWQYLCWAVAQSQWEVKRIMQIFPDLLLTFEHFEESYSYFWFSPGIHSTSYSCPFFSNPFLVIGKFPLGLRQDSLFERQNLFYFFKIYTSNIIVALCFSVLSWIYIHQRCPGCRSQLCQPPRFKKLLDRSQFQRCWRWNICFFFETFVGSSWSW